MPVSDADLVDSEGCAMITRYANTPFAELIRMAEDSGNELLIELAQRLESEIENRVETILNGGSQAAHESGYQEGFSDGKDEGFSEGQKDTIERLDGELCEACAKIVGEL